MLTIKRFSDIISKSLDKALLSLWAISSVGQSHRLITGWSGVRVPDGPPYIGYSSVGRSRRSPKPRAEGSSPFCPCQNKKTPAGVFFVLLLKQKDLNHEIQKCKHFLTVNSPVDCLRIELIIKPLPKKHRIFSVLFHLFTLFYGYFACFPI